MRTGFACFVILRSYMLRCLSFRIKFNLQSFVTKNQKPDIRMKHIVQIPPGSSCELDSKLMKCTAVGLEHDMTESAVIISLVMFRNVLTRAEWWQHWIARLGNRSPYAWWSRRRRPSRFFGNEVQPDCVRNTFSDDSQVAKATPMLCCDRVKHDSPFDILMALVYRPFVSLQHSLISRCRLQLFPKTCPSRASLNAQCQSPAQGPFISRRRSFKRLPCRYQVTSKRKRDKPRAADKVFGNSCKRLTCCVSNAPAKPDMLDAPSTALHCTMQ